MQLLPFGYFYSAGVSRGQPTMEVAVCALRRIRDEDTYEPCHYEVCIVREGIGERCALPSGLVKPGAHPERLARHELTTQTHLQGERQFGICHGFLRSLG